MLLRKRYSTGEPKGRWIKSGLYGLYTTGLTVCYIEVEQLGAMRRLRVNCGTKLVVPIGA